MDERERRMALNEAMFRQVNEAVSSISSDFEAGSFEIVCECGAIECTDRIPIGNAAYAALRSEPHRFAVIPGHERPEVEEVIATEDGYHVVEKTSPEARRLAERTDPNT
jgi:hypothetical protein